MAKKPTVTTLQSGFNSTETLNANFEALRDSFDNTLSLDGSTPNAMEADLDLNGNNIIGAAGLLINGTDYLSDVEAAKAAALAAQAAAETAETNAETAETNAESAETASAYSALSSAGSASAAATSEAGVDADRVAAQAAATAASTSETNATASETAAGTSETNAATSQTNAATSATNAATSATESETAKTGAEAAKDAALAALDNFDDRYLGAKASDPTLDNDGNALVAGALYYNTTDDVMKVYTGSVWVAAYASLSGALLTANNLSDVASASSARTNLGLGTTDSPTFVNGTFTSDVTIGDDLHITGPNPKIFINDSDTADQQTQIIQSAGVTYHRSRNAASDGSFLFQGYGGGSTTNRLKVEANGDVKFYEDTGTTADFLWDASTSQLAIAGDVTIGDDLFLTGPSPNIFMNDSDGTNQQTQITQSNGRTYFRARNEASDGSFIFQGYGGGSATEFVRFNSNGRVGIGTASPTARLHVSTGVSGGTAGAAVDDLVVESNGNAGITILTPDTGVGQLVFGDATSANQGKVGYTHNGDYMTLTTSASERLRIDASGNVGIGTTSPAEKLSVTGNITATGTVVSQDEVRAEVINYASNQDAPYMIAASTGYTGATTNWGTYGFQHRLKSNGSGEARITTDTSAGEVYSMNEAGDAVFAGSITSDTGLIAGAGAAAGSVGSYALLAVAPAADNVIRNPGSTLAGSSLDYANANRAGTTSPAGTWRLMGHISLASTSQSINTSVWLRIS